MLLREMYLVAFMLSPEKYSIPSLLSHPFSAFFKKPFILADSLVELLSTIANVPLPCFFQVSNSPPYSFPLSETHCDG